MFAFLKRKKRACGETSVKTVRKEESVMNTEFLKGIVIEENPLLDETPEEVIVYDVYGNVIEE